MEGIDRTIQQVERFYRVLTGNEAPPPSESPYAVIPPERNPVRHVEEQIERLIAALGTPTLGAATPVAATPAWTPPLSVTENARELVICVDLPGVEKDDVDLQVVENRLLLQGRRPGAAAVAAGERFVSERPAGRFERIVPLPFPVEPERLSAQMKNGVLEVRIAKAAPRVEPRAEIPIQ